MLFKEYYIFSYLCQGIYWQDVLIILNIYLYFKSSN